MNVYPQTPHTHTPAPARPARTPWGRTLAVLVLLALLADLVLADCVWHASRPARSAVTAPVPSATPGPNGGAF